MTLILSFVSWPYVLQVSDRLVSSKGQPFSPMATKTVLYVAADGIMAISYTGSAYLAGMSTDRWIAETLAGEKLAEGVGGRQGKACLPIGLALGLLQEKLALALIDPLTDPSVANWPFEMIGVGWRWGKKHAKPVGAVIEKKKGASEIVLRHYRQNLQKNFSVIAAPSGHATPVVKNLRPRLRAARDHDETETALISAIRERAAAVPGEVGRDCTSILLPPPGYGYARVRYHESSPAKIALIQPSGEVTGTIDCAAFSPWVIGPGHFCSPSVLAGTFSMNVGGFHVEVEAPEPTGHIVFAMGAVTPPPQPPFKT